MAFVGTRLAAATSLALVLLCTPSLLTSSHAALIIDPNINKGFTVGGQLCCTRDGNCPTDPVGLYWARKMNGGLVKLKCENTYFNLFQGPNYEGYQDRTDRRGIFNITVPELEYVFDGFDSIPCKAVVRISFDRELCPALADKEGYLVSELKSLGKANGLLELEPSGWSVQPCWLEA